MCYKKYMSSRYAIRPSPYLNISSSPLVFIITCLLEHTFFLFKLKGPFGVCLGFIILEMFMQKTSKTYCTCIKTCPNKASLKGIASAYTLSPPRLYESSSMVSGIKPVICSRARSEFRL